MKAIAALALLAALGGCATCQQHPVYCAVGSALIVGSIAASIEHHHDQQHAREISFGHGPQIRPNGCDVMGSDGRASGVVGSCVP